MRHRRSRRHIARRRNPLLRSVDGGPRIGSACRWPGRRGRCRRPGPRRTCSNQTRACSRRRWTHSGPGAVPDVPPLPAPPAVLDPPVPAPPDVPAFAMPPPEPAAPAAGRFAVASLPPHAGTNPRSSRANAAREEALTLMLPAIVTPPGDESAVRAATGDTRQPGEVAAGSIGRHTSRRPCAITAELRAARGRNGHAVALVPALRLVGDAYVVRTGARVAIREHRALGRGRAGAGVAGAGVVDGGDLAGGARGRRHSTGHRRGVAVEASDTSPRDASHCAPRELPGIALALNAGERAGRRGRACGDRRARAAVRDQLAVGGGHALGSRRGRAAGACASACAASADAASRSRRATSARGASGTGRAAAAASARDTDRAAAPAAARRARRPARRRPPRPPFPRCRRCPYPRSRPCRFHRRRLQHRRSFQRSPCHRFRRRPMPADPRLRRRRRQCSERDASRTPIPTRGARPTPPGRKL